MPPNQSKEKGFNQWQLNAFQEEHFSIFGILASANHDITQYINFIKKSMDLIRKQDTLAIPVVRKTPKSYLSPAEFSAAEKEKCLESYRVRYYLAEIKDEKLAKRIETEVFEKGVRTLQVEIPTGQKEDRSNEVKVLEMNFDDRYLELDTEDELSKLYVEADTYQLKKQKEALIRLKEKPAPFHEPLLRLFSGHNRYFEKMDDSIEITDNEWFILTDKSRNGTLQQREFVLKALQSNDFALMEGPPGSGKTTVIIELILQLAKRGKRVLLCSSTHVAIDNVLDRILEKYKDKCEGLVLPIRIARNKAQIRKESVQKYHFQEFVKQKKDDLKNHLLTMEERKTSHDLMLESLKGGKSDTNTINSFILDAANVVAGTMIGILQHPAIKNSHQLMPQPFDVMIVDEASKVTFPDFIVPALHAKKWILVGDVKQLSPYIEDDYVEEALDSILEKNEKKALEVTFELKKQKEICEKQGMLQILISNEVNPSDLMVADYENYEYVHANYPTTADYILKLNAADWVLCEDNAQAKKVIEQHIYVKSMVFEDSIFPSDFIRRQDYLHKKKGGNHPHRYIFANTDKEKSWKEMLASRLSQQYQYRKEPELAKEIATEVSFLMPENEDKKKEIEKISRVALPSILELLQEGIGKEGDRNKILYDGFGDYIKELKFTSLTFQHRMQDDIVSTSRKYFYNNELHSANTIEDRENPLKDYKSDEKCVVWVHNNDNSFRNKGKAGRTENVNPKEVQDIRRELEDFREFARTQDRNFEVAVITFYKKQEAELRKMLQGLTNQRHKNKNFTLLGRKISIKLHTVDEFQGDEADLVLLSFTLFKSKAFYNSPNRLNVALTRARYKLVLFGNVEWFKQNAPSNALKHLATNFDKRISTHYSPSHSKHSK